MKATKTSELVWLTGEEVSEITKLSVRTLGRWRDAGKLSYYRPTPGTVRYRLGDVVAVMERSRIEESGVGEWPQPPQRTRRRSGLTAHS